MRIESSDATIRFYDVGTPHITISRIPADSEAAVISVWQSKGFVVLARHKNTTDSTFCLIAAPSHHHRESIEAAGYEILEDLSSGPTRSATPDTHDDLSNQKAHLLSVIERLILSADPDWEDGEQGNDWADTIEYARTMWGLYTHHQLPPEHRTS